MCVDCVLASLRIAQVNPDDGPLLEVVLSHRVTHGLPIEVFAWKTTLGYGGPSSIF
jgi:hypothetical protein